VARKTEAEGKERYEKTGRGKFMKHGKTFITNEE
jgi:hypothetical protein